MKKGGTGVVEKRRGFFGRGGKERNSLSQGKIGLRRPGGGRKRKKGNLLLRGVLKISEKGKPLRGKFPGIEYPGGREGEDRSSAWPLEGKKKGKKRTSPLSARERGAAARHWGKGGKTPDVCRLGGGGKEIRIRTGKKKGPARRWGRGKKKGTRGREEGRLLWPGCRRPLKRAPSVGKEGKPQTEEPAADDSRAAEREELQGLRGKEKKFDSLPPAGGRKKKNSSPLFKGEREGDASFGEGEGEGNDPPVGEC